MPTVRYFEENGVSYREDLRTGQRTALPPRNVVQRPSPTTVVPGAAAAVAPTPYVPSPVSAAPAVPVPVRAAPAAPAGIAAGSVPPPVSGITYPASPYTAAYAAPAAALGVPPGAVAAPLAVPAPPPIPGTPGRWNQVLVSAYEYRTRWIGRWNPFRSPVQVTERVPVMRYEWRFVPDVPQTASAATAVTAQRVIRY